MLMAKNPIKVRPLTEAGQGYRVLASWKLPKTRQAKKNVNAWIPALTPSHTIRRWLSSGVITWDDFAKRYRKELESPSSQDFLKPLALLSKRRTVILLCERGQDHEQCSARILARALKDCRRNGNFALSFSTKQRRPRSGAAAEVQNLLEKILDVKKERRRLLC